jgi:hypothetical protein
MPAGSIDNEPNTPIIVTRSDGSETEWSNARRRTATEPARSSDRMPGVVNRTQPLSSILASILPSVPSDMNLGHRG